MPDPADHYSDSEPVGSFDRSQIPRGGDRRQTPRRADDAAVHYATSALVQAALNYVDAQFAVMRAGRDVTEEQRRTISERSSTLRRAAITYRDAETRAGVSRGTRAEEPANG